MRRLIVFCVLYAVRLFSRTFYRQQVQWVGKVPAEKWPPYRLVAILNHTSLCEFLFSGQTPASFLWRMAGHCTLPIAEVTIKRPLVGLFWRMVAANPISITRERDNTWEQVLEALDDPDAMLLILPEGRMKRGDGLDKNGRPMTVRAGIADLLRGLPDGKMLLCYSQGLHHIQIPGEGGMKLGQPVRIRFETVEIDDYKVEIADGLDLDDDKDFVTFKRRIKSDLEARRDRYATSDLGGTDEEDDWLSAESPPFF
ncbi:MAG: hypothetical protein AAGM22_08580 [Acidobacteriota bacterium]